MTFEVLGKIKGKGRPRFTKTGHAYTPKGTREYEYNIKRQFYKKFPKFKCVDKPIQMTIIAVFGIPKGTSKKKTEKMLKGEVRPTKKPDADNISKIVCDALNKVAYIDDSQIVEQTTIKKYGIEEKVIIELEEIK